MPDFAYRIIPPRAAFPQTLSDEERAVMSAHWAYVQQLDAAGRIRFVGRCENGDYGIAVFTAADLATARATAAADPAVASGLMRVEVHAFKIVLERPASG